MEYIMGNKYKKIKFYVRDFIERYNDREVLKNKSELIYIILKKKMNDLLEYIDSHKGVIIFLITLLLCIVDTIKYEYIVASSVLYILSLVYRLYDHKVKKDMLNMIDMEEYNKICSEQGTLDKYINDCFNRQYLLYIGYKDKSYINKEEENKMLKDLLDDVALNMSKTMREKLMLYYGSRIDYIITEKCYITVMLFVANNNKTIYEKPKPENPIIKSML